MTQIAVRTIKTNLMLKAAIATIFLCVLIDEGMSAAPQEPMPTEIAEIIS